MTLEALYNYQHGDYENKLYSSKDYTPESIYDNYVLAKIRNRLIIDSDKQEAYENQVVSNIINKIEKEICDTFK